MWLVRSVSKLQQEILGIFVVPVLAKCLLFLPIFCRFRGSYFNKTKTNLCLQQCQKQVSLLTFWNNYFSEQLWQAASATYFLHSCKYVYTALAVHAIFFTLQNTVRVRENTSSAKSEICSKSTRKTAE